LLILSLTAFDNQSLFRSLETILVEGTILPLFLQTSDMAEH